MKITVALFLSLVLLFPTITKSWLIIDFAIHQKEIAATLCENKDKPKLQCNGKCQMMKSLKKAEEPQPWKYQHGFSAVKEVKQLFISHLQFNFNLSPSVKTDFNSFLVANYPKALIKPALKPPCA
jgi:hypothetical protein